MKKIAFLFPGQSSQYVGMGKELYEQYQVTHAVYERAEEITGLDIRKICFEGPLETLNATENTQPCILTMSYATLLVMREYGIEPSAIAGFSMGEFSAMVAAGIISFEDGLRILQVRAKAMQEAVPLGAGAMVSIKTDNAQRAIEICEGITEGYVALSNINTSTSLLFAGEKEATNVLQERLTAEGIKNRVIAVSVPSHCKLMEPARKPLEEILAKTAFTAPKTSFFMCADGEKEMDVEKIREKEVKQLCVAVQCEGIIRNIAKEGIDTFIEIGPKQVYSGYVRENLPDALVLHVEDQTSLQETLEALKA